MPLIAAGVLLAAVGGGAWFALGGGGEANASDNTEEEVAGAGDDAASTDELEATNGAADSEETSPAVEEAAAEGEAKAMAEKDAAPEITGEAEATLETPAVEAGDSEEEASAPNSEGEMTKPASEEDVNLAPGIGSAAMIKGEAGPKLTAKIAQRLEEITALEPFEKPAGIDDAAWTKLVADAALVREGGGASVKRAAKRIGEAGQYAFPAVMNELISMDLNDPRTFANGKQLTDALNTARGSTNEFGFGWRPSQDYESMPEPKDVSWNLGIVVQLHGITSKIEADPAYWAAKVDKTEQTKKSKEIERKAREAKESGELSNDDFDFDGE